MPKTPDFKKHNEMVARLWQEFEQGSPSRVPAVLNVRTRYFVFNKEINQKGYTFKQYYNNPKKMMKLQLEGQKWSRLNVIQDRQMGLPEQWDGIFVDFRGVAVEAIWLGCEPFYCADNVLDCYPLLKNNRNMLYELDIPSPIHDNGIEQKTYDFYQYLEERRENLEFEGRPIGKSTVDLTTAGPFTVATKMRGTSELCLDIYEKPNYVHDLLSFVTEAIIRRIKAWSDLLGIKYPQQEWFLLEDTIAFLSSGHLSSFSG